MGDTQKLMEEMPSHLRTEVAMVLYRDLIGKTPFFQGKSSQFIAAIVTNIYPVKYSEREIIGEKGEIVQDWYIIRSGVVELVVKWEGKEKILMTFVAGSTFGEMGILLGQRWQIDVRAATNCEVLSMSRRSMKKVFHEFPQAKKELIGVTQKRIDRLAKRMRDLRSENAMDRANSGLKIEKYSGRSPSIFLAKMQENMSKDNIQPKANSNDFSQLGKEFLKVPAELCCQDMDVKKTINSLIEKVDNLDNIMDELEHQVDAIYKRLNFVLP